MTPRGLEHCNDLQVRAPSSPSRIRPRSSALARDLRRGLDATLAGRVTRRLKGISCGKFPRGTPKVPSETTAVEQVLRSDPPGWTGHRRRIRQVPASDCQVGVGHFAAPASYEARRAPAEADGHFRSMSLSLGATRVAVSVHPKAARLAQVSACSHEESGCSARTASKSRVRTPRPQRRWQASASTRGLSDLAAFEQQFP